MNDSAHSRSDALQVRLAEPGEEGLPFREWLARRTRGDRRATERQLAFLQQWDHLRDEAGGATPSAYSTRWRVSPATAYRLLEEFRTLFPLQEDPDRLLELLWEGLSERYLGQSRLGSLMDVKVVRDAEAGPRDLREILPPITNGRLEEPVYDARGLERLPTGDAYQAYESPADRFAWAPLPTGEDRPSGRFVTFILEGDADDIWRPASGSTQEHEGWDEAEMACAARWAAAEGMRLQGVGVRIPTPVFRLAPGARPTRRDQAEP